MKFSFIIFDFDGTLVDSMPTFAQAMVNIFKQEQLPYPDDFVKIITPLGYKGTAQYAIKCGYTKDADTFVSDAAAAMVPAYLYDIPLKADVYEKLQQLRKHKGLTQEELAERLYVSRTAVSKWESGRGYPSIDSLKEISKFFSVTIDELLSSE